MGDWLAAVVVIGKSPDWEDNEDCPGDDKEVAEFRCNVLMDGYQKEFILLILYARKQTVL